MKAGFLTIWKTGQSSEISILLVQRFLPLLIFANFGTGASGSDISEFMKRQFHNFLALSGS